MSDSGWIRLSKVLDVGFRLDSTLYAQEVLAHIIGILSVECEVRFDSQAMFEKEGYRCRIRPHIGHLGRCPHKWP